MRRFLRKHSLLTAYILWGIATTLVNFGVYFLFTNLFHVDYIFSNIAAWFFSVLFAFWVNKSLVFHSGSWKPKTLLPELGKFLSTRIFSGLCETALLWLCVDIAHLHDGLVKILAGIFVVTFNYIFSKLFIFKRKD